MYPPIYVQQKHFDDISGNFFDIVDCDYIANHDCDIFTYDGRRLCSLRKKIISNDIASLAITAFKDRAKKETTNSRGVASGKVDINKMSGNIVEVLEPGKFKSKVRLSNGNVTNYKVSNTVNSMIAGYYDKPKRSSLIYEPIRLTAYCEKYPHLWQDYAIPYVEHINDLYEMIDPQDYYNRKLLAENVPYGMISDTIFTTLTINHNFRTAAHVDSGDLSNAYSILTCHGEWSGGYLIYPHYGVGLQVEDGDLVVMNPHEYHCNSPIFPSLNGVTDRLSIVLYARQKIINPY